MDTLAQSFITDIDQFLARHGLEPSAFGKQALGDPNFIFDLKKGRSPSTRTMDKVRAYMAAQQPAQAITPAPARTIPTAFIRPSAPA